MSNELLIELVQLVRSERFVDGFLPSCRTGPILAFILDAAMSATPSRETRLVLDLGCGALLVPAESIEHRERSFFPTFYLDFLGLAGRALPDDAELARFIQQERSARQSHGTSNQ
ncbi:MAG TPA: hypothetical protein VJR89_37695 [Polyangiales bacterium]|nr:hypothetical protein [Polyangiales bacterium]